MAERSGIGWTEASWNPTVGCIKVSPGCDHCYAEPLAVKLQQRGIAKYEQGFTPRPWEPHLELPLRWRKPKLIFVDSMSDLFHRAIPREYVAKVWQVMIKADWHTYQLLTKRPHRMVEIITDLQLPLLDHIWLGVSAENCKMANSRIPALLQLPARTRWVSAEPLLEPLDLTRWLSPEQINWVVSGAESGPDRREAEVDWFRSLRDQCRQVGVPYYHKQGGAFHPGRNRELDGVIHDARPSLCAVRPKITITQNAKHSGTTKKE